MKKRLIALLLAFVMVLGLTATVFAEGGIRRWSMTTLAHTNTSFFQAGRGLKLEDKISSILNR